MRLGLFILTLLFTCSLAGQNYKSRIHYKVTIGDEEQLHQLILADYTKLLGTALEVDERTIRFKIRSSTEVSVIPTSKLRYLGVFKAQELSGNGGYSSTPTVGFTDLTYEPTALPYTTKGEVKVINLIYATTEWNLNEHVKIGVGLAGPLGILATQRARWSLSPLIHVGVSNKLLYVPVIQAQSFNNRLGILGDVHGMITIGTNRRFLNFGTGILYDNTVRGNNRRRAAWGHRMAIGSRLSSRWTIYTEALMILSKESSRRNRKLILLPTFNAALSVRRHRWNFGIATVQQEGFGFFPPPIPYIGYSYYWGKL